MDIARQYWATDSHEHKVESFYSHGVENYGDFHKGYLNFGLWEDGISDYVVAAENLVHKVAGRLGLTPGSRLLDVACGMGTQDVYIYEKFGPVEIDALDLTWKHLPHALRRAQDSRCEHAVRFHHGSATRLPFAAESFTHALSIEGPFHYHTRERFFQESFRVLRGGGVLALADFAIPRKPRGWEVPFISATKRLWNIPEDNLDSMETYRMKLAGAGFRNIRIDEAGAHTFPGYYQEQRRRECRSALARIRGVIGGRLGQIIDHAAMGAYARGLVSYILVRAEKPLYVSIQVPMGYPAVAPCPATPQPAAWVAPSLCGLAV